MNLEIIVKDVIWIIQGAFIWLTIIGNCIAMLFLYGAFVFSNDIHNYDFYVNLRYFVFASSILTILCSGLLFLKNTIHRKIHISKEKNTQQSKDTLHAESNLVIKLSSSSDLFEEPEWLIISIPLFLISCIMFNPIIPISLWKPIWIIIDMFYCFVYGAYTYYLFKLSRSL